MSVFNLNNLLRTTDTDNTHPEQHQPNINAPSLSSAAMMVLLLQNILSHR